MRSLGPSGLSAGGVNGVSDRAVRVRAGLLLGTSAVLIAGLLSSSAGAAVPPALDWAVQLGGDFDLHGNGIAVDGSGNVYTIGDFSRTVDFDPGPGTANLIGSGGADVFVSKLDAAGNYVWARHFGSTNDDEGLGIAVDGSGTVHTTGTFSGTVDFDPGGGADLTSNGGTDVFVSKLDAAGNHVWARHFGSAYADRGVGIAVDGSGNVYTTGSFRGTVDFDPGAGTANLPSNGGADVFVSMLDSVGNHVWARHWGSSSLDRVRGIAVDGTGNTHTIGEFFQTVDFDPGAGTAYLGSAGMEDVFVSKLDPSGNYVWAIQFSGPLIEQGHGIAVDGSGTVHTTGWFSYADFDPSTGVFVLESDGSRDAFVSQLVIPPSCNGLLVTWDMNTQGPFTGTPGDDVVLGTDGADVIDTGYGNDTVCGLGGDDVITTRGGIDWVDGGDGDDTIRLGARDDTAYGGNGADVINGGGGADHIEGGAGNDVIRDSFGADTSILGNNGDDVFVVGRGTANVYDGGGGTDRIDYRGMPSGVSVWLHDSVAQRDHHGTVEDTLISIEEARGSRHDDWLEGDDGDNVLIGHPGNDTLVGMDGDDTLVGDRGDDQLYGGDGWDYLVGGDGAEVTGDYCLDGEDIHPSCEHTVP